MSFPTAIRRIPGDALEHSGERYRRSDAAEVEPHGSSRTAPRPSERRPVDAPLQAFAAALEVLRLVSELHIAVLWQRHRYAILREPACKLARPVITGRKP